MLFSDKHVYSASDLPITSEGRIYHLHLLPSEIASNILLVGDPDRVPFIAENFLSKVEVDIGHRGLRSITGIVKEIGIKISIVTSGMGTPSLEIVLQELFALNEIDFKTRRRKSEFPSLNLIRVGTSGGLQANTALGTAIISSYAVGMDNTGLFYEVASPDEHCFQLEERVKEAIAVRTALSSRFLGKIVPYVSKASPEVVEALTDAAIALGIDYRVGITVSNSGFFANQGREISRVPSSVRDLDLIFSELDSGIPQQHFENMEMEASFLLHFARGCGYKAGVICPTIANRRDRAFADRYLKNIKEATEVAILAFYKLSV